MVFVNSLRLLGANLGKALKFFLYYIVVWGICIALFLPCIFEFKDIFSASLNDLSSCFAGVFKGNLGQNLHSMVGTVIDLMKDLFNANLGLAIYGVIVVLVILPFLVNVGKYTFDFMLYSYMTSKNQLEKILALCSLQSCLQCHLFGNNCLSVVWSCNGERSNIHFLWFANCRDFGCDLTFHGKSNSYVGLDSCTHSFWLWSFQSIQQRNQGG